MSINKYADLNTMQYFKNELHTNSRIEINDTLDPENIVGDSQYSYTFSSPSIKADSIVIVSVAYSATENQMKEWAKFAVVSGTQQEGSVTIKAVGVKPSSEIPIVLTINNV